jgi:uncharacterized membrane protein YfcA
MSLTIILATSALTISTGLKTMQSRTIALRNYTVLPAVAYVIALLELSAYSSTIMSIMDTQQVWPLFVLALGASVGSRVGVYVADLISNKEPK